MENKAKQLIESLLNENSQLEIIKKYKDIFKKLGLKSSVFDKQRSKGRVDKFFTKGYIINKLDYKDTNYHLVDKDLFEKIKKEFENNGLIIDNDLTHWYSAGVAGRGTYSGIIRIK